jgi:hypothetical protein
MSLMVSERTRRHAGLAQTGNAWTRQKIRIKSITFAQVPSRTGEAVDPRYQAIPISLALPPFPQEALKDKTTWVIRGAFPCGQKLTAGESQRPNPLKYNVPPSCPHADRPSGRKKRESAVLRVQVERSTIRFSSTAAAT